LRGVLGNKILRDALKGRWARGFLDERVVCGTGGVLETVGREVGK
jgi:hypothetical protein